MGGVGANGSIPTITGGKRRKEMRVIGNWQILKGTRLGGGQIKLKKREQLKNLFKLGKIWMGV